MARETFELAGVDDVVTFVQGDARDYLADLNDIAFCFLDAEKEVYGECYEAVVPRMIAGGLLVADNAINQTAFLAALDGTFAEVLSVDQLSATL